MKISFFLYILFFNMTLVSIMDCHSQSVTSDYNTKIDFKKYKTYAWMAPGDSVYNGRRPDKVFGGYIVYSANEELKKKGMTMDLVQPDAVFIFNTNVQERTEYMQSPTVSVGVGVAVGAPGYYGPGYYVGGSVPVAGGKITEKIMEDGILAFDMYDTKTHELIWSGMVEKTFSATNDDVEVLIGEYTKRIFKKFPVKSK